ncbi:MAG: hypothetical protein WAL30_02125, partial [Candidatus Aquirickettsiella sp.]
TYKVSPSIEKSRSDYISYECNEKEFLDKYEKFFENKNHFFEVNNQIEIKKYFDTFKERRRDTSKFVEPKDEVSFLMFEKYLKKLIFLKGSLFLNCYSTNQQFLNKAELLHEKEPEIEKAEAQLKLLRNLLIKSVIEQGNCDLLINEENLSTDFVNELRDGVLKKAEKVWPLRFGMLFSLGVGACVGVITFYTFPAVLIGLGLTSLTILSAIIWPLAILSAISYAILIYNTITDLILTETLSKWWKELNREIGQNKQLNILKYICLVIGKSLSKFFGKLIKWFKFQQQESYFSYVLRMVLSLAVLVFGFISAFTTGYTAFIQLQNYVSLSVCLITALPLMLSDLLFTLKNSFETVGLLSGISINNLLNPIKQSYQNLKNQVSRENYLQFFLQFLRVPLKLMLSVLKLFIFGFHVFFTSVASDRFFSFPCWLTVFFAAGSEFLTDICPLFGNKQGGHHDHDHGGIFNWIGKIVFIIPATILGILNCLFSQLTRWSKSDTSALSLWEAIKQEWQQFDIIHEHEHLSEVTSSLNESVRKLPKEVVLQKAIHICDKQISRLGKGFFKTDLARQKIIIFQDYKEKLKLNIELEEDKKFELGKHRFFKTQKTESIRQWEKIQSLIKDSVVNEETQVSNGHARVC